MFTSKAIARVHSHHLMNAEQAPGGRQPLDLSQYRPNTNAYGPVLVAANTPMNDSSPQRVMVSFRSLTFQLM